MILIKAILQQKYHNVQTVHNHIADTPAHSIKNMKQTITKKNIKEEIDYN